MPSRSPARASAAPRVHEIREPQAGLHAWLALAGPGGGLGRLTATSRSREDAIRRARSGARRAEQALQAAELDAAGAHAVLLDHDGLDEDAAARLVAGRLTELDPTPRLVPGRGLDGDTWSSRTPIADPDATAPASARTALAGIRGVLDELGDDLEGSRVLLHGFDPAGRHLAQRLEDEGALVRVAVDDPIARARARSYGFEVLPVDRLADEPATVLAPAGGGPLTARSARQLSARSVCGPAWGALGSLRTARVLQDRGIAHAPAPLAAVGGLVQARTPPGDAPGTEARIERLAATMRSRVEAVLAEAREVDVPPAVLVAKRFEA